MLVLSGLNMFKLTMNFKSLSCALLLFHLTYSIDGFKLGSTKNVHSKKDVNATDSKSSQSDVIIVLPENVSSKVTQDLKAEPVTNTLEKNNETNVHTTKGILPNLNDFDTPLNYSYAASVLYPHYTKFYIEPTPKPQKSKISKRLARPANFVMQRKEKYFDIDPVPGEEDNDGTRIKESDSSKLADDKKTKNKEQLEEGNKSEEDIESEENKGRVVRDKERDDEEEEQEEGGEDDEDYEDEEEEREEEEEKAEEIKQKIIEKSRNKDSKEHGVDLSEDEAHVNYALSLEKNIPKTAAKLVADSEAEGSKKEADHIIDQQHEKGGGKKHHAEHHGEHGEHGEKGYKGFHKDTKGAKGHHDKEAHKNHYDDQGGHEEQHHEEQGHHGEHHQGEKGSKNAEYEESGQHSKGHSTKGSHDVHKKDEYEKKVTFFEEDGDSGEEEKFGGYSENHSHGKGGEFHKGHHLSKDFVAEKGDEKHFTEGGHHMDNKGHKKADGHSGHHAHHMEFGKKNGRDVGKKWRYAKGLGGDHRSAKIIQHRSDKGDSGHDGQASEHRRVIQKPKVYSTRPVHPYVQGAAFIQRRNDDVVVAANDLVAHTNAYKQFPLESISKPRPELVPTHFVQRRMDDVKEDPEQYIAEPEEGVKNEQKVDVGDQQKNKNEQKADDGNEAEEDKAEKKVQVVKYEEEFENQPTDKVQETTKYRGYLVNEQAVESTQFGEQEPFDENKEGSKNDQQIKSGNTNENNGDSQNHLEIKREVEDKSDNSNSQESREQRPKEEPEFKESPDRESEESQAVEESEHHPKTTIKEYDDVIEDYPQGVRTDVRIDELADSKKGKLEIVDDEEEEIVHINKSEGIPENEDNPDPDALVIEENPDLKTVIIVADDDSKKNISDTFTINDDNDEINLYDEIVTRNTANDVAIPDDPEARKRSQILKAEKEEYIRLAAQSRGKKGREKITGRGPRSTVPTEDKVEEKVDELEKATVSEQSNNNSTKKNPVKKSKKRSKKAKSKSKKNKKKKTTTTEKPEVQEDPEAAVAGDSADFF